MAAKHWNQSHVTYCFHLDGTHLIAAWRMHRGSHGCKVYAQGVTCHMVVRGSARAQLMRDGTQIRAVSRDESHVTQVTRGAGDSWAHGSSHSGSHMPKTACPH